MSSLWKDYELVRRVLVDTFGGFPFFKEKEEVH